MVHLIEFGGMYMALDVESGSVHAVDREAMRVLMFKNAGKTDEQIIDDLGGDAARILEEIRALIEEGTLYSAPADKSEISFPTPVIKALCLLISQDCPLNCGYCFADAYHKNGALMDFNTAKASLDFLIKNSGNRKNLEVDFFGGEPLLNFDVIKKTVAYGRGLEKQTGKVFRFTLTTNAYNVTQKMADFINAEMKNVVISIDGREEVHDAMRRTRGGENSFNRVLENARLILSGRGDKEYYVRGTYTNKNLDFAADVLRLAELGFDQISLEPAVGEGDFSITEKDIPRLKNEYEILGREYLKRRASNKPFHFFHFNVDLTGGPCLSKRLKGCGAGSEYLAVAADGTVYPCHQFAGNPDFEMGSVRGGELNPYIKKAFLGAHVFTKEECGSCWAKYYCSGGCAANAYNMEGDLKKPYRIGCELEKKRIETAIAIQALKDELTEDENAPA